MHEAAPVTPPDVARLRQLAHDNLARSSASGAVFFSNKLVTLTQDPADVLLLARVRRPASTHAERLAASRRAQVPTGCALCSHITQAAASGGRWCY